MAEFGKIALDNSDKIEQKAKWLVKQLHATFSGNQELELQIDHREMSTIGAIREQATYNFDWETVETKRYTGGIITWCRFATIAGKNEDKTTSVTTGARKRMEVQALGANIAGVVDMDRKTYAAVRKVAEADLKNWVTAHYVKQITKYREALLAQDPMHDASGGAGKPAGTADKRGRLQQVSAMSSSTNMKGDLEAGQGESTTVSGVFCGQIREKCRDRGVPNVDTTEMNALLGNAYSTGGSYIGTLAEKIATALAGTSNPVLKAKYDKFCAEKMRLKTLEIAAKRAGKRSVDDLTQAERVKALARANDKALRDMSALDKYAISAVVAFTVTYNVVKVDQEKVTARWLELEQAITDARSAALDKINNMKARLFEAEHAGQGKATISASLTAHIDKMIASFDVQENEVEATFAKRLKNLEEQQAKVQTLLTGDPRFANGRIDGFKIALATGLSGYPVKVYSRDSNVKVSVEADVATDGDVLVNVSYLETAKALANWLPGGRVAQTGTISFSPQGWKSEGGAFAKQWAATAG